jgi:alginate O-acetyltransferase complex protein AlgI
MLFNSYSFILAFLPVSLLGFFLFGKLGKSAGAAWLAASSLFFYAWWDTRYLFLLLGSIGANYLAGSYIAQHSQSVKGRRILIFAIVSNLVLLAYYKYADFFVTSANAVLSTQWPILGIILPIGISFFTFTQIAFLADSYAGKVKEYRVIHYILFVTYFPHLIAGPVLHHKEMMPQFADIKNYSWNSQNVAIGFSIFALGLAKKVLIADNLAPYASAGFSPDIAQPTFFLAWGWALAYTFQLYFDFSGYSDMAIGLSRMFGIKLPLNFHSPYKSENIAEFWRRWHMTLSRFLRDYLYIPLGGNRCSASRRRCNLFITMVLGGLWHGAGWTFVIWGALHGSFLIAHQIWMAVCGRLHVSISPHIARWLSICLTFFCVVIAWVYFRSPDVGTANRMIAGMFGWWGSAMPEPIMNQLGAIRSMLESFGVKTYLGGGAIFVETWTWITIGLVIAFAAPNTQQIMCRFEPSLPDKVVSEDASESRFTWQPSRRHAIAIGVLFGLGFLALGRPTEFLYFQF